MKHSRRDVACYILGLIGPLAVWAGGLAIVLLLKRAVVDDYTTTLLFDIVIYDAIHLVLPWIPMLIAIGLARDPRSLRTLPWIAAPLLTVCQSITMVFRITALNQGQPVLWGVWVVCLFWLFWPMGMGTWAMHQLIRIRIEVSQPPAPTEDTPASPSLGRDITSICLATLPPVACWFFVEIIHLSSLPQWLSTSGLYAGLPYLQTQVIPWAFVLIAIHVARRPAIRRALPVIAWTLMGVVALGLILSRKHQPSAFPFYLMYFGTLVTMGMTMPALAMILWSRRRARTFAFEKPQERMHDLA
jgi:hypothetical protein